MTKFHARQGLNRVHQFRFLKDHSGACRCGWAVAKIAMTALRAQRLAKVYGKDRLGPVPPAQCPRPRPRRSGCAIRRGAVSVVGPPL